ncbi:MAG: serine/threonine protein kinase, partial [Acidobacteriota bacterium]|nr:serine/threonine protein kinase [Acidobacteriota bacterium]
MDRIGRYQIASELGRGAMGVVYRAIDPNIGRPVAIKTIRLNEVDYPERRAKLRERLFREARAAGVLSHPGIVTVHDMDEEDGLAYIAMEFVNGPTLEQLMASGDALEADRLFHILRQTAAALDFAHQKGIVHRDVKPANLMLDEEGAVRITDFGIAKMDSPEDLTMSGAIVGTPNYMSPEQVQGADVDGATDQFSLAVVAYEILTGERPFSGERLTTVVYKIVATIPDLPHGINPTLGPEIDAVLNKGLAKNAADRYPNCGAFVGALELACAATRGWRPLGRRGSLALP